MACVRLQYGVALYIYRSDSSRSEDTRTRPLPLTPGAWRRRGAGRVRRGGREGHRGGATRACPLPTASQPRHLQRGTPVRCCLHLTRPPQPTPHHSSQTQPFSDHSSQTQPFFRPFQLDTVPFQPIPARHNPFPDHSSQTQLFFRPF
ncbi:hypothetical protein E2C01_024253 [Portunus trituberculatus]|uniref:Uncharacterized protein n=1 Tax=Portunus trituberculatus TaxID=210409 RepID=A0A5B7E9U8_PORTR|nr:hypothetical protein [Portunus trituberculatus]